MNTIKTIMIALILIGCASPVIAGDDVWGPSRILRPGSVATLTPTTSITQTQTVETVKCDSVTVTCYGATMTGLVQMCNNRYGVNRALSQAECQDVNLTAIDCASTHSVQIDPAPAQLRLAAVTNEDSSQNFQVSCNGSN